MAEAAPQSLIVATREDMLAEAKGIVDAARAQGIVLRMLGGLAARLYCRSLDFCERDHGDIDLIGHRRDARRIEACGSQAYQIETNGACHLDAHSVGHALEKLDFTDVKICIIENVGNLVCPAAYELGEAFKVAILSTPEGDDKVLKYPSIFSRASIVLINKMDIAGYLDFDVEKVKKECKSLNDQCDIFSIAAKTGQGVEDFCQFLKIKRAQQKG